jgi:class 3 adenylate cyclase/tetratricopeptide (TPR) repeat protein
VIACPACGFEAPDDFAFCPKCATRLEPLPAEPRPPVQERKVVTTLFCDLVAFTALSETADPEDVDALLGEYSKRARRIIESHGGTVEKFIGDAVVGVFGVPATHEDDPERAVRAGLRLIEALEGMRRPDGSPLQARVGVNTGEALVRLDIDPASGRGFLAGDAVNTAARLQAAAPPAGVAVGALTHELTARVIDYQELPPIAAKGKAEPVETWLAKAPVSRTGVDLEPALTPLVDRDTELSFLRSLFERAAAISSPQVVLAVGEPGIGKSRLVRELFAHVDSRSEMTTWRQGRCLAYGEGIAFWPLAEIVKAQAGVLETDGLETLEAKLEVVLPDGEDRAWFRQRLRALLGLEAPQASREENFTAWLRFIEELAAKGPTVLVFEDLHWADEALLAFLEHLVNHLADVPLLVVTTARPELLESNAPFAAAARVNRLVLEPLSLPDTAALVGSLLGEEAARVSPAIVAHVEGNPFFAEESARLVRERGDDREAGPLEPPLAATVQAVIAARLDVLSPAAKGVLADAAVVGEAFWDGALVALGDRTAREADEALAQLASRQLIRRLRASSMAGETEFVFSHALAREVAYAQLPRAARAHKHAALAGWLERKAGGRREERVDIVAHHYATAFDLATAAGDEDLADRLRQPALDSLTLAGERALPVDVPAAERYLSRALALLGDENRATPRLLWGWAMVLSATRRPRQAAEVWRKVIARLQADGELRRAAVAMNELWDVLEKLDEPRGDLDRAALDLFADDEPSLELVQVLASHAMGSYLSDALSPEECRAALDRAIEMAAELGLPEPARVLGFRGAVRCTLGELGGLDDFERGLTAATAEGLGDDFMEMQQNYTRALMAMRGPAAALEACGRGLESARRRGDEANVLMFRVRLVNWLYWSGDWDATLHEARDLDAALQAADDAWTLCLLRMVEGILLAARGRPEEAAPFLGWLVERGRVSEAGVLVGGALVSAAAAYFAMGQAETALGLIAAVAERRQEYWNGYGQIMVRTALAAGDADLAARLTDAITRRSPWIEHVRTACLALTAEARGENETALTGFADAAVRWRDFGVPYEEAQALLGQGRCLVALGRAPEAAPLLRAAREIFARLGARPALEETDKWLAKAEAGAAGDVAVE